MTINLSLTPTAIYSRKYSMLHHDKVAAQKLQWLRNNKDKMKLARQNWIEANRDYFNEYMRLSNLIASAKRHGDSELEAKLRIDRKILQSTLPERKTLGRIVK